MSAAHYTRKLTFAETLNLALSPVTFHYGSYFNAILSPYTLSIYFVFKKPIIKK